MSYLFLFAPIFNSLHIEVVALGGLVVSVLATGSKIRGLKPGPRTMDFKGDKILARLPSEGK
jgi:hypothetical protein